MVDRAESWRVFSGAGRHLLLAASTALCLSWSAAAAPALQDEADENFRPRAFQLYDTQAARALANEAADHVAAGRWSEAIVGLQALIEDHRGEVLGAQRPRALGALNPSQTDVHPGAASWAAQALFGLPAEGQDRYRERYGRRARLALERAIAAGDRGGLSDVARRWPLTESAERAWWALGDLELELGHAADGLRAWARAAALRLGVPQRVTVSRDDWAALRADLGEGAPGALARADLAMDLLEDSGSEGGSRASREASFSRGPATSVAAASITSSAREGEDGSAGWPAPFQLTRGPFANLNGASRLFPQRVGDVVIVNTSRSVHAVDAFDGSELWSLESSALGWDDVRGKSDFDDAVDTTERIVTAAAGRGIVVAPLQVPFSFEQRDQYNEMSIIEEIPERRLIALDLATGERLWDTMPPPAWDGDSGSFEERMTVVGPPTVVGARVLVPMARLRGRIELHLGCFDLASGEVLWSAPVVTGQRTLNMFGRANVEFSAPPPVVLGDTIIVATQLGLVAALDLFTGETRWDALYEQVPIQPPQYYAAGWIANRWRNAPPIIVDDTVLVAPFDGEALIALDAETGATLWSIDQRVLTRQLGIRSTTSRRRPGAGLELLLAADQRRLLLGGTAVVSIEFPRGTRLGPPLRRDWAWPLEGTLRGDAGFPAVDADSVFVPTGKGVVVLDRQSGRIREEVSGGRLGAGQLLVADGMLFSTDGDFMNARFEWAAMVARARAAAGAPGASGSETYGLVRLLLERAEALLARGTIVEEALGLIDEAEAAVAAFDARHADDPERVSGAALRRYQIHRGFLLRARGERLRGDADAARVAARNAVEFSASRPLRLEALLALHEIERTRDPLARAAIVDGILERHAGLEVAVEATSLGAQWSAESALGRVMEAARENASTGGRLMTAALWIDPWEGPLTPRSASLRPESENIGGTVSARIPAGLFARISQVEMARALPDLEVALGAELAALHAILRDHPAERLFDTTSAQWAAARIFAIRMLHPRSAAIANLEAEADEALASARSAYSSTGSDELLERLPRLYPGSAAATRAAEDRVAFAIERGDPEQVAQLVISALSFDWHPARCTAREASQLVRLAEVMGEAGNLELRANIALNLARYRPSLEVELASTGKLRLEDLAARWRAALPVVEPVSSTFDQQVTIDDAESRAGDFTPVGSLRLSGDPAPEIMARRRYSPKTAGTQVLFAASRDQLAAVSPDVGVRWAHPADLGLGRRDRAPRVCPTGDSVIVAERDRVISRDAATGEPRWEFEIPDRGISSATVSGGVAVIVSRFLDTGKPAEVYGLDTVLGIQLWKLGVIGDRFHPEIKVANGRFVLLPLRGAQAGVHDLSTGQPLSAPNTGQLNAREAQSAWADGQHLVLATIEGGYNTRSENRVVAFDLDDGSEAWRVDLDRFDGGVHNLVGLVDLPREVGSDERVRLAMLERVGNSGSRRSNLTRPQLGLHVIDEENGIIRRAPLAAIDSKTHLVGVNIRVRVVLDSPLMIGITENDGGPPLLEGIHASRGVIWRQTSARPLQAAGVESLAAPALGDGVIAMLVRQTTGQSRSVRPDMRLMFLDSATGRHVETRSVESGGISARWRNLNGIGGSLVMMGARRMAVMQR
jgi:outer membrane protein assembly factor BamB